MKGGRERRRGRGRRRGSETKREVYTRYRTHICGSQREGHRERRGGAGGGKQRGVHKTEIQLDTEKRKRKGSRECVAMVDLASTAPCGISSSSRHVSTSCKLPPCTQPPPSYANRGTLSRHYRRYCVGPSRPSQAKGCAVAYQQVLGEFMCTDRKQTRLACLIKRRHVGYRK